jgi:hypothetical protein
MAASETLQLEEAVHIVVIVAIVAQARDGWTMI